MDWSFGGFLPTFLWIVFLSAAVLSAVLGLVLAYHWFRYSFNPIVPFIATVAYAGGCFLFLFVMFAALLTL